MKGWQKWVGLAGVAGVAATGIFITRRERTRRAYTPEQVRSRLHERYAEATGQQAVVTDLPRSR